MIHEEWKTKLERVKSELITFSIHNPKKGVEIFDDFEKGTWTPTLQNSNMKNDNYSICDNGVVIKYS